MHLQNPKSNFDRQVSYPRVSSYVSTNLLLMQFWIDRIGVVISALRDSFDCGVVLPVRRHQPCVHVACCTLLRVATPGSASYATLPLSGSVSTDASAFRFRRVDGKRPLRQAIRRHVFDAIEESTITYNIWVEVASFGGRVGRRDRRSSRYAVCSLPPSNPEPLVTCTDNEDIQFYGDVRLYTLQHINL